MNEYEVGDTTEVQLQLVDLSDKCGRAAGAAHVSGMPVAVVGMDEEEAVVVEIRKPGVGVPGAPSHIPGDEQVRRSGRVAAGAVEIKEMDQMEKRERWAHQAAWVGVVECGWVARRFARRGVGPADVRYLRAGIDGAWMREELQVLAIYSEGVSCTHEGRCWP